RRTARGPPGRHRHGSGRRPRPHRHWRANGADRMRKFPIDEQKDWLGRGWAYPVRIEPLTGATAVSEYEADIRQSIRIILGTSPGERVMRPDFGCGIYDLVFDVIDAALLTRIETSVLDAMKNYEARIEV